MEQVARYVNLAYVLTGLLMAWLMTRTVKLVFDAFGSQYDQILFAGLNLSTLVGVLLGAGGVFYLWRHEKTYTLSMEIGVELSKVTWPNFDETKRWTYVVIVFSIIVALFLAACDFLWKAMTDAILL